MKPGVRYTACVVTYTQDRVPVHTIGGPTQSIAIGPQMCEIRLEVTADTARDLQLFETFAQGCPFDFLGHEFKITEFRWKQDLGEEFASAEVEMHGSIPPAELESFQEAIRRGYKVFVPREELRREELEQEEAARIVQGNAELGSLEDLT